MTSSPIQVAANSKISSFLLMMLLVNNYIYLYIYTHIYKYLYNIFFICSSTDGHIGWLHILFFFPYIVLNNATMNLGVQTSFQVNVFVFFG